jgi:hypothetical protein
MNKNHCNGQGETVINRLVNTAGIASLIALLSATSFSAPLTAAAEESKLQKKGVIVPTELDQRKLSGVDLQVQPPFVEPSALLAGKSNPRGEVLFRGEELIAEVYEDDALKMAISEPFPHDEFILVLNGELILTDAAGVERTYAAGDSLVLPKGFTGIWHASANFRELVVIERKVYDATYLAE